MNSLTQFAQAATSTCTVNGQPVDCSEAASSIGAGLIGFAIFGIIAGAFTLWMFIHALTKQTDKKVMWALIIFFTGIIGALIYFFTARKDANSNAAPSGSVAAPMQAQAPGAAPQQPANANPAQTTAQPAVPPAQQPTPPQSNMPAQGQMQPDQPQTQDNNQQAATGTGVVQPQSPEDNDQQQPPAAS